MSAQDFTVAGEFTIYQVATLKSALLEWIGTHEEPRLDLSGVTEMDGAGLQLLLFAQREARALGKALPLAAASAAARAALTLAGIEQTP